MEEKIQKPEKINAVQFEEDPQIKRFSEAKGVILGLIPNETDDEPDVFVALENGVVSKNVCVTGPSGSGKNWCYILPNVLQAIRRKESVFVLDLMGEMHKQTKSYLNKLGYEVRELYPTTKTQVTDLIYKDDLTVIAQKPCAFFCKLTPFESGSTAMVKTILDCLLDRLVLAAGSWPDGRAPVPVNFFLDEFPSVGKLPFFDVQLDILEHRNVKFSIVMQSLSQLKRSYPDCWESILDNCGTLVCYGIGFGDLDSRGYVEDQIAVVMGPPADKPDKKTSRTRGSKKTICFYEEKYPQFTDLKQFECLALTRKTGVKRLCAFPADRHPDYKRLKTKK